MNASEAVRRRTRQNQPTGRVERFNNPFNFLSPSILAIVNFTRLPILEKLLLNLRAKSRKLITSQAGVKSCHGVRRCHRRIENEFVGFSEVAWNASNPDGSRLAYHLIPNSFTKLQIDKNTGFSEILHLIRKQELHDQVH